MREQFTNSCPKDVSMFLKERSPKDLEEWAKLAEKYLNAHGKKLSTKAPMTKQDVKTNLPRTHEDAMRCYVCDGRGHSAVECPSKASTLRNKPFGHGRRSYCFKCGAMGHEAQECKTALLRSQPGSRAGGGGVVSGGIQPKLNELHARSKCHGEVTKRKPKWGWKR